MACQELAELGGVALLVVLDPPHHEVVFRSGQRHVQEPALLGRLLGLGQAAVLPIGRALLSGHIDEPTARLFPGLFLGVVEHRVVGIAEVDVP